MSSSVAPRARVAVIIPCYNDGATVGEAFASIEEDEAIEVVVVDDGSSETETLSALEDLEARGVHVVHQDNQGLPEARNTALANTTAPYVFPLDADDLAVAGSLAKMADTLDRNPAAAACYGEWYEFGSGGERRHQVPPRFDPYLVAFRNRYPVASLFRRRSLERTGGWHKVGDIVGYEDWNLWMSIAENREEVVRADGVLAIRYRVHGVRMLVAATSSHRQLYETMKKNHPGLFAELTELRRDSILSPLQRLIYPYFFGPRQPSGVKRWLREQQLKVTNLFQRPSD